jgi:hypothetical protein
MSERHDDEPEIEGWIRDAMHGPAPQLSPAFDRVLARRLRPARLGQAGRWVLVAYAVAGAALSVWLMRRQALDWVAIAAAFLVAIVPVVAAVRRPVVTTIARREA